ncbi:MAG: hypothetical protein RBR71_13270 [Gudongella sp.]|jgi:hypothetical protein|nr:hypothetical protein [Gudongella sp.]
MMPTASLLEMAYALRGTSIRMTYHGVPCTPEDMILLLTGRAAIEEARR